MLTNRLTLRIEWGDCDPAGIAYFPRYLEYFDTCTRALFERAGFRKRDLLKTYGIVGIPVVDLKARFMVPSRFGEDVTVESSIIEWRNSSFVVQHRLRKGDVLAIECLETRVWVAHPEGDPEKMAGRPIPHEVKERFVTVPESNAAM